MDNSKYFFAYGALADQEILTTILGESVEPVGETVLNDYVLVEQMLSDIVVPEQTKSNLMALWGSDFLSLAIKKQAGKSVKGTLIKLNDDHFKILDDWELVEDGWFVREDIEIRLPDDTEATTAATYRLSDNQPSTEATEEAVSGIAAKKNKIIQTAHTLYHKK